MLYGCGERLDVGAASSPAAGQPDRQLRRSTHGLPWLVATILVACVPIESSTAPASPAGSGTAIAPADRSSGPSIDPALVGAASGRDPLLPTLGNGGYDVRTYDVDVDTNPVDDQTTIRVSIEAVATQRLGRFSLDYSGITPGSVSVDDVTAAFTESGGKLIVTSPRPIEDGGAFQTVIDIAGRPTAVRGVGWAWRGAEQLSAFGIYDAVATWLPTNADPADKALIETHVTVPRPYTAVGPGALVLVTDVAGGRQFDWRAGPSNQFSIVVRDYEVADLGTVAGVPLTSYEPKDLPAQQREALNRIPTIFEHLSEVYGPFPFDTLSVVWVDGLSDMEGPDEGLLKWGPQRLKPTALAHHLTHIWFSVNVTPSTSHESYLRAAFANYADLLWIEHADGVAARDAVIATMHAHLGPRTDAPADPSRIADNDGLFIRGPLSLQALRVIVGDDTFFEILRTWVVRFHRQAASVEDFVDLSEQASGRSLNAWRQGWLLDEAVPPLSELGLGSG
jgi:aminopeptidase N